MTIEITALAQHGFYVRISSESDNSKTVAINPVLSVDNTAELLTLYSPNYLLMTHLYTGWEDIALLVRTFPSITVVAQDYIIQRLKSEVSLADLNTITMAPGNEVDFPWTGMPATGQIGSLVMTELHPPETTISEAVDIGNGFIINAEGHQIYHTGFHPFQPELRNIGAAYKPDVVLFPVSKALGYGPEEVYRALMWVGCDIVIPFDVSEVDLKNLPVSQPAAGLIAPEESITGMPPLEACGGTKNDNSAFDFSEVYASIDIYTPAICRVLAPGQSYSLEPTHSSGRTAGPESRY